MTSKRRREPVFIPYPIKETQYVTREVIEKRAPTDESIKLLKEMQDESKVALIDSVRVSNGSFEMVLQAYHDAMNDQTEWHAVTQINGKRIEMKHYTGRIRGAEAMKEAFDAIKQKFAETIASEMLTPEFIKIQQRWKS